MRAVPFWKVAGGANDYILLDGRGGALPADLDPAWVRALCARRWSVGSDGILYVLDPREGGDYRLEFYNPDGTTHGLCGNGARCVARVAALEGWAGVEQEVELIGGTLRAEVLGERVRIHLTAPRVLSKRADREVEGRAFPGELMEVWVPHLIVELPEEDLEALDVGCWGGLLRNHADFRPEGTNVTFAAVTGPGSLSLRTYERGVEGETLACGSGATAAAASMVRQGRVEAPVDCLTASRTVLTVAFGEGSPGVDAPASLEGDARIVARGILGPDAAPSIEEP